MLAIVRHLQARCAAQQSLTATEPLRRSHPPVDVFHQAIFLEFRFVKACPDFVRNFVTMPNGGRYERTILSRVVKINRAGFYEHHLTLLGKPRG